MEIVEVVEISTENLVAPNQIGWIAYREGCLILRVKVIKFKQRMFLSHVAGYGRGIKVRVISYADQEKWDAIAKILLQRFASAIEEDRDTAKPNVEP